MHCLIEFFLAIRALEEFTASFGPLRAEPIVVTRWARFVDRLVIRNEIAGRIVRATPKFALCFSTATFDQVAGRTLRTFDAARYRACVFAGRILAASHELAEPA